MTPDPAFSAKNTVTTLPKSIYSDLAPCDFWLFPKFKYPMGGQRFQTIDKIKEKKNSYKASLKMSFTVSRNNGNIYIYKFNLHG
jgi:hypothetical protein